LQEPQLNWIANFIWGIADDVLRDTEQVPLLEKGGTDAFIRREVLPYARIDEGKANKGCELSFTRSSSRPPVLRSLDEMRADILALERDTEGLLDEIIGGLS
jgi:type I restriction enzyme M protein